LLEAELLERDRSTRDDLLAYQRERVRALVSNGDERERYLARSHQSYPWWEPYHHRAAPRQIPVIMLEPSA
jgi:hypothetical protein